jgi:hypothetical protein
MIDWPTLWLIIAATSWVVSCVLAISLVIVLNRDRADTAAVTFVDAERARIVTHLVAEWDRELRGYERGRVTRVWPALARHLDDLTRAR